MRIILSMLFLFSLSFDQIQKPFVYDMAKIHDLRSKTQRDITVELPDGSQRSMSRCDFVALNPDAAHIDPETSNQRKNLHRSDALTIPVAFHVIHKTDLTGNILQSDLDAQIDVLNATFGDSIQFQQYSVDYNENESGMSESVLVSTYLNVIDNLIPIEYALMHAYPNPFNPVTNITYGLPEHINVQIIVYDLSGKQVETLMNQFQTPGYHTLSWNASSYPSGIYLIRMESDEFTQTQKVVLIK